MMMADVIDKLKDLGCDPIEGMAQLAMDETTPIPVRARLYAELAQYAYPRRKAVEHWVRTSDGDGTSDFLSVIGGR